MITSATAAHWFDLPTFYAAAARMLKPGGTIALWTGGSWYVDKMKVPNGEGVQAILDEFEMQVLKPFELPGNRACRELYANIDLPWTTGVEGFDEETFVYKTWNKDGKREQGLENGYMRYIDESWDKIVKGMGTSSMVTRWREAYKEKLDNGEIEDVVVTFRKALENAVNGDKQPGDEGYIEKMSGGTGTVLLTFRKQK
jgi:trans-aconitate 3-methyltransferase